MRCLVLLAAACTGTQGPSSPSTPTTPVISNSAPSAPATHELMASIKRTACYGRCPIYELSVFRDGKVEYTGERFVKTTGAATWQITAADVAAIDALFASAHYLDMKDAYRSYNMTDMPSTITSYQLGNRKKRIQHYLGDDSAPAALGKVEAGLDTLVHIEKQIGTDEERQKMRGH